MEHYEKFIVFVGCTFGLLFLLLGANGHLVASDVDASMASHKTGNYTIDKILSSYEGEEFFTKDYVDGMFNNWSIDENTKVIADEEGGLFYSLTDNHAALKTYDTDSGQVVEELSLDSPRATTVRELKEALYEALEE